jgi:hypothetical protein
MDIESTKVTPEEIAQFRAELADNPKALADIDVIERCEGYLEQAARILARRADIEDVILNPLSIGYISGQALMQEAKGKRRNR